MGAKFSTEPLKNPVTNKDWSFDPEAGANPEVLHHFARFGILGFKELNLLLPHHERHIYRTIQLAKATNNKYIQLCDWQQRHRNRLWNADLFYQLAQAGLIINTKHAVPDYEPLAGSDFDHRAMSVRWMVSLYAGVKTDERKRLVEWPEIRARLSGRPAIEIDGKRINTDWRPFGFQDLKENHYQFSRGPEIDCGTEQFSYSHKKSSTIDNKLLAHAQVAEERLFHSVLGLPNDFVPFVTINEDRKETMKAHLAQFVKEGTISRRAASTIGFAVFPYYGSKEPFDTRAYTMPYERVGHPDFYFNA
jgi:hypothetical protein